jgi:hypothetical protein
MIWLIVLLVWVIGMIALTIYACYHSSPDDDAPLIFTVIFVVIWPLAMLASLVMYGTNWWDMVKAHLRKR